MGQFNAALAAAFDLDPARLTTITTGLVIDDLESPTGLSGAVCTATLCGDGANICFTPDSHLDVGRAASCAVCFGDGSVSPCSAPPLRPEG